jgi:septum formation protein
VELSLASSSPRRAALLDAAGITFRQVAADLDETPLPSETPDIYVARLALAKARLVVCRNPSHLVLAADTTVVVGGRILGKPADAADAAEMLGQLSGQTHDVLTGVALACDDQAQQDVARTRVRFATLSPTELAWYVDSGEPLGMAGAYAIQGLASRFVEWIDGSYSNVVGLPIAMVYRLLRNAGWAAAAPGAGHRVDRR